MDEHSQLLGDVLCYQARRGELTDFLAQGAACQWCARPVRLEGALIAKDDRGRFRIVSSSARRADGVVRKACGNRRASVCPSCSSLYRADARQ
jgi:hypothetical protein